MPIVHAAVANFGPVVLCAHTDARFTGNFASLAKQLLTSDELPTANQSVTYKCDAR